MKPAFNIGDKVYHNTPESTEGIVVDIIYYYRSSTFRYLVAVGWDSEHNCTEEELSETKVF